MKYARGRAHGVSSEFVGANFFREEDGTIWASAYEGDTIEDVVWSNAVSLFDPNHGESLEDFITALRNAVNPPDPLSRLLEAVEEFIAGDERDEGTPVYRELMAAYDALVADIEESADEDESEDDEDGEE